MAKKLIIKNFEIRVPELHIPIEIDYPSAQKQIAEENLWRAIDFDYEVVEVEKNGKD